MVINILQDIVLALFIATSFFLIIKEKRFAPGIIVTDDTGHQLTNGKQGISTSIGRGRLCDVQLRDEFTVSELQANVSYKSKLNKYHIDEYGQADGESNGENYKIAGRTLHFALPSVSRCFDYGFIPTLLAMLFVSLKMISAHREYGIFMAVVPHFLLLAYIVVTYLIRGDKQPISECILSILLTFYISSSMYFYSEASYKQGLVKVTKAIVLYIALSLLIRLLIKLISEKPYIHSIFRISAFVVMLIVIILHRLLAVEEKGAFLNVIIGSTKFQPSEIVKLLYAFVLICPSGKKFTSKRNVIFLAVATGACFAYGLVIRDIGALLQLGVMFLIAVILQTTSILWTLLIAVGSIFSCKIVLLISATANYRVSGWRGSSGSILEAIRGMGTISNSDDYGYQPLSALTATFKNGGLFGNQSYKSFNILSEIKEANTDLVCGFLGQKFGSIAALMLLALFVLLIANTLFTLRQKNKTQQVFSTVAIALISAAAIMNIGGSFGVIPLTGIVCPALSAGASSAFSYGCMFGLVSSTSVNRKYLKAITQN